MRRPATIVVFTVLAFAAAEKGYAEEDRGSAGYLVALCKTYIDLVDKKRILYKIWGEQSRLV